MSTDTSDEGYDESTPGQPSQALAPSVDVDPAPTVDPDGAAAESNHQVDGADADTATDRVPDPKIGMKFKTQRELADYYRAYAHQTGFSTSSLGTEKRQGRGTEAVRNRVRPASDPDFCRIHCNRGGIYISTALNPNATRRTQKTNCKAKINCRKRVDGFWRITTVELKHNHHFINDEGKRYMRNNRRISEADRYQLLLNDSAGISMGLNFSSVASAKGGLKNVPFTEKDGRNMIAWEKNLITKDGDFTATVRYLEAKALECPNLFYAHRLNDEGVVTDFLWVDGRGRAAFEDFGDVVSFDATYMKNRYKMPFAPFIGVNHHGMSTILGCALITSENTETYTWVFEQWIRCMNGKTPSAIITDQDPAMAAAIAKVMPDVPHRWCIWHIMQNAHRHLRIFQNWESHICPHMTKAIYNSVTLEDFKSNWEYMLDAYGLWDFKWLQYMFTKRERWVPAYFRGHFWTGMSSTQRSEGMNNFFKVFFSVNTTIIKFVKKFDLALAKRVEAEDSATFKCKERPIQCSSEYLIEKVFYNVYTDKKFTAFQEQLKYLNYQDPMVDTIEGEVVVYNVTDRTLRCQWFQAGGMDYAVTFDRASKKISCMCREFEFNGILCCHIIKVLWLEGEDGNVHDMYVLDRWRIDVVRHYQTFLIAHYNPLFLCPEPKVYSVMRGRFEQLAQQLVGNDSLRKDFMNIMLEFMVASNEGKAHGHQIDEAFGGGRVYRRKPLIGPASSNYEGQTSNSCDPTTPVKDPPDKRRRGRTKTHFGVPNKKKNGKRAPSAKYPPVTPVSTAGHDNVSMGKTRAKRARTAKDPTLPPVPTVLHTSPQPVHHEPVYTSPVYRVVEDSIDEELSSDVDEEYMQYING